MMGAIIIFILGSIIGSFLNVCIYRIPRGMSIVTPSSHCPMCKVTIPPHYNIPIFSYIILGGKCKECGAPIPFRYFAIELLTASLFLAIYTVTGPTAHFVSYATLVSCLIAATFIDYDFRVIPDDITVGGLVTGLLLAWLSPSLLGELSRWFALLWAIVGALAGGISIYIMGLFGKALFKKEAMGDGDMFLMAMVGAFLGWKLVLLTFFLSPFFGLVHGIVVKLKRSGDYIPYGPYLSMGAIAAMFFGEKIIKLVAYGF